MGGKACKTPRLPREQYFQLKSQVLEYLTSLGLTYFCAPEPTDKDSFGDLDILILQESYYRPPLFDSTPIVNGNCHSYNVSNFQVDILYIRPDQWDLSKVYYSNGDLCMVIGRISRAFNVKFGWDSIEVIYRNGTEHRLFLTQNPSKFFNYLGTSLEAYLFSKTLEDDKAFLRTITNITSKYVTHDTHNRSRRKREELRPRFAALHAYMLELAAASELQPYPDQYTNLAALDAYFPEAHLFSQIAAITREAARTQAVNFKWSGQHIGQVLGLQGQELGVAVNHFNHSFPDSQTRCDFILNSTRDVLINRTRAVTDPKLHTTN